MRLADLQVGAKFRLPFSGLTGEVLRQSPGGVLVQYDGQERIVEIAGDPDTGRETKSFVGKSRPVVIAPEADVVAL